MVKFTEIKDSTKTTLPSAPWKLKDDYKRSVKHNGHTYELTKYVRAPNLLQRLTCALTAAWLWLKSCGQDKKIKSNWDKAKGDKPICLRFGKIQKTEELDSEDDVYELY